MKFGRSVPDSEILETWKSRSENCAESFFQTADWASLLVRHFPQYRLAPIETKDFFIPLIRERRYGWFSDSLYGMPMMTRGGVLAEKTLGKTDWEGVYSTLMERGVGTVVISTPPFGNPPIPSNRIRTSTGSTHVVHLEGGWPDVESRFERRCRKAIRRAGEEGVEVSRDRSDQAAHAHWELIRSRFEEWKPNPKMTYEFIRDCVQYPNGRLYLARKKDRTVGTVLGFASRSELFLWQGSRAREEYPIGTENLLIARMIEDACAEGIRTVDLGASLGDPGIEKFKESFGAEKTEYTILKWTHPFLRLFKKE